VIRQVVFVPLDDASTVDDRTKAIEAACNLDWLAEYRLVDTSLFTERGVNAMAQTPKTPTFGYYLFFEKD
jgi:hypothetical protein